MQPVDVLIVGGGPAGLATAIAASRKGLRVAVIDCRRPPIDKTCGEGLLPSAIAALDDLGVRIDSQLGFPFTEICFVDETSRASAAIKGACGIGLRRRELHGLLMERAEAEGVSLSWGARISEIGSRGVWANGEFRPFRWLIGADGQHSRVRKFAELDPVKRVRRRFGFRRRFATAAWSQAVEVHWGEGVQLIVTPTGREEVCVVVLARDPHMRIEEAMAGLPEMDRRLRGAQPISSESGATTCLSRARSASRGNVALVGDASCTMDGISGSGLSLAFQEALALADALARENLAEYQRAHARITRVPLQTTRLLLWMERNATVRRAALRFLQLYPAFFSKLIALHAGHPTKAGRSNDGGGVGRRTATAAYRVCEPS